jgi:hypothetical protein
VPGREGEVDDLPEEPVGDLQQDARAVPGVRLRADRTAVLEVSQRLDGLGDDVVARDAGERRDEGHPARVVLVEAVVEPLGRRQCLHCSHGGPFRVVASPASG